MSGRVSSAPPDPAASATPSPGPNGVVSVSRPSDLDQIVNTLMDYRTEGESAEFTKQAIHSLVRKLKDKSDELHALIDAVTASKKQTLCVTIPKTLDGRLQVATRKHFPHHMYAKIWRWPDVHKNELKQEEICKNGFECKDKDVVCVNPYHYRRNICPELDLRALSLHNLAAAAAASASSGGAPSSSVAAADRFNWVASAMRMPAASNVANAGTNAVLKQETTVSHEANGWIGQRQPTPTLTVANPLPCNNQGNKGNNVVIQTNKNSNNGGPISRQPLPEHWCSIAYFEQDTQVGETFKVPMSISTVTVDGYVSRDGWGGRFCLGALTNVHRTEASERTRLHIGRGVQLVVHGEGDVYVRCLSAKAIFVQSYYLDREAGRAPGDAVHKIHPEAYIKVFDLAQCHEMMQHKCAEASRLLASQAAAVLQEAGVAAMQSEPEGVVDAMRRLCIVRLSFVKGWGKDYKPRRSIKETPCWIEVHLHRALQLCDEVLHLINRQQTQLAAGRRHIAGGAEN